MRGVLALQIDFQQRHADAHPRLGWLVLVLGALLLSGAYAEYMAVDAEVVAVRSRAEEPQRAVRQAGGMPSDETGDSAQATKAASLVREQLATPWGALFVEIESAAQEDIAMLSLQADPSAHAIRISGEARNFTALMAYVRRLEASEAIADVRLAGHEVRQQDPRRPVAFSLSATWVAR